MIDIQSKIDAYRSMWLITLTQNDNLRSHMAVMTSLVGVQKGGLQGADLLFVNQFYCRRLLRVDHSKFYEEAFNATPKLCLNKQISDLRNEKVFYNPIFRDRNLKTIPVPKRCERAEIFTYGEILDEYTKQSYGLPHAAFAANIFPKIVFTDIVGKVTNNLFITELQALVSFGAVTCKDLYGEIIRTKYTEHHSVLKWETRLTDTNIDWGKVWASVCNPVATEKTKTVN